MKIQPPRTSGEAKVTLSGPSAEGSTSTNASGANIDRLPMPVGAIRVPYSVTTSR